MQLQYSNFNIQACNYSPYVAGNRY